MFLRGVRLMKGFSACLLAMTVAVTAFAGTDGFVVANIDHSRSLTGNKVIVPPKVTETYEYYEVCGCSEKDLQCELKQKSILWNDGKKYDSETRWKVKWDYDYSRAPQACIADSFQVNVEVVFRYPKWVRNGSVSRQLEEKWDAYMDKLIMHEKRHRDIVVEAADELSRAVAEMPAARSCAELDREVAALCRNRMGKLIEAQNKYDENTSHGYMEGAVFP
jgi:predicted secreted Zn-dependent protease